jgi:small subunit ribosomal protein S7
MNTTNVSTDDLIQKMIKEGSNVPRKGHTQKRDVLADPLYNDKVVTKLINNIMLDGKRGVAQKIVYGAFERVAEKSGKPALEVFEEAMNNIMPALEVKARRIGGATYQVPIEVRPERRQALALRWLTMFSRKEAKKQWKKDWQMKLWTHLPALEQLLREKKTCIKWQRQIKHLLTIDSNLRIKYC